MQHLLGSSYAWLQNSLTSECPGISTNLCQKITLLNLYSVLAVQSRYGGEILLPESIQIILNMYNLIKSTEIDYYSLDDEMEHILFTIQLVLDCQLATACCNLFNDEVRDKIINTLAMKHYGINEYEYTIQFQKQEVREEIERLCDVVQPWTILNDNTSPYKLQTSTVYAHLRQRLMHERQAGNSSQIMFYASTQRYDIIGIVVQHTLFNFSRMQYLTSRIRVYQNLMSMRLLNKLMSAITALRRSLGSEEQHLVQEITQSIYQAVGTEEMILLSQLFNLREQYSYKRYLARDSPPNLQLMYGMEGLQLVTELTRLFREISIQKHRQLFGSNLRQNILTFITQASIECADTEVADTIVSYTRWLFTWLDDDYNSWVYNSYDYVVNADYDFLTGVLDVDNQRILLQESYIEIVHRHQHTGVPSDMRPVSSDKMATPRAHNLHDTVEYFTVRDFGDYSREQLQEALRAPKREAQPGAVDGSEPQHDQLESTCGYEALEGHRQLFLLAFYARVSEGRANHLVPLFLDLLLQFVQHTQNAHILLTQHNMYRFLFDTLLGADSVAARQRATTVVASLMAGRQPEALESVVFHLLKLLEQNVNDYAIVQYVVGQFIAVAEGACGADGRTAFLTVVAGRIGLCQFLLYVLYAYQAHNLTFGPTIPPPPTADIMYLLMLLSNNAIIEANVTVYLLLFQKRDNWLFLVAFLTNVISQLVRANEHARAAKQYCYLFFKLINGHFVDRRQEQYVVLINVILKMLQDAKAQRQPQKSQYQAFFNTLVDSEQLISRLSGVLDYAQKQPQAQYANERLQNNVLWLLANISQLRAIQDKLQQFSANIFPHSSSLAVVFEVLTTGIQMGNLGQLAVLKPILAQANNFDTTELTKHLHSLNQRLRGNVKDNKLLYEQNHGCAMMIIGALHILLNGVTVQCRAEAPQLRSGTTGSVGQPHMGVPYELSLELVGCLLRTHEYLSRLSVADYVAMFTHVQDLAQMAMHPVLARISDMLNRRLESCLTHYQVDAPYFKLMDVEDAVQIEDLGRCVDLRRFSIHFQLYIGRLCNALLARLTGEGGEAVELRLRESSAFQNYVAHQLDISVCGGPGATQVFQIFQIQRQVNACRYNSFVLSVDQAQLAVTINGVQNCYQLSGAVVLGNHVSLHVGHGCADGGMLVRCVIATSEPPGSMEAIWAPENPPWRVYSLLRNYLSVHAGSKVAYVLPLHRNVGPQLTLRCQTIVDQGYAAQLQCVNMGPFILANVALLQNGCYYDAQSLQTVLRLLKRCSTIQRGSVPDVDTLTACISMLDPKLFSVETFRLLMDVAMALDDDAQTAILDFLTDPHSFSDPITQIQFEALALYTSTIMPRTNSYFMNMRCYRIRSSRPPCPSSALQKACAKLSSGEAGNPKYRNNTTLQSPQAVYLQTTSSASVTAIMSFQQQIIRYQLDSMVLKGQQPHAVVKKIVSHCISNKDIVSLAECIYSQLFQAIDMLRTDASECDQLYTVIVTDLCIIEMMYTYGINVDIVLNRFIHKQQLGNTEQGSGMSAEHLLCRIVVQHVLNQHHDRMSDTQMFQCVRFVILSLQRPDEPSSYKQLAVSGEGTHLLVELAHQQQQDYNQRHRKHYDTYTRIAGIFGQELRRAIVHNVRRNVQNYANLLSDGYYNLVTELLAERCNVRNDGLHISSLFALEVMCQQLLELQQTGDDSACLDALISTMRNYFRPEQLDNQCILLNIPQYSKIAQCMGFDERDTLIHLVENPHLVQNQIKQIAQQRLSIDTVLHQFILKLQTNTQPEDTALQRAIETCYNDKENTTLADAVAELGDAERQILFRPVSESTNAVNMPGSQGDTLNGQATDASIAEIMVPSLRNIISDPQCSPQEEGIPCDSIKTLIFHDIQRQIDTHRGGVEFEECKYIVLQGQQNSRVHIATQNRQKMLYHSQIYSFPADRKPVQLLSIGNVCYNSLYHASPIKGCIHLQYDLYGRQLIIVFRASEDRYSSISIAGVTQLIQQRYLFVWRAVELIDGNGAGHYLLFETVEECYSAIQQIHRYNKLRVAPGQNITRQSLEKKLQLIEIMEKTNQLKKDSTSREQIYIAQRTAQYGSINSFANTVATQSVTTLWERNCISNYDYLMMLNTYAGRTFNDLAHYPVFPWVLRDYESDNINLSDASIYRDFGLPIAAQGDRLKVQKLQQKYRNGMELARQNADTPTNNALGYAHIYQLAGADKIAIPREDPLFSNCQNGLQVYHSSHFYQTAIYVAQYLCRLQPYTDRLIELDGKIDYNRGFVSIPLAFHNIQFNDQDNRELIPEFFTLPQMLVDDNKVGIGDVELPKWASDSRQFIRLHRQALESDYTSANLNLWIDLIFGIRQQGQPAAERMNLYGQSVFYESQLYGLSGNKPVINASPELISLCQEKSRHFGHAPAILFNKPHPQKQVYNQKIQTNDGLLLKTNKHVQRAVYKQLLNASGQVVKIFQIDQRRCMVLTSQSRLCCFKFKRVGQNQQKQPLLASVFNYKQVAPASTKFPCNVQRSYYYDTELMFCPQIQPNIQHDMLKQKHIAQYYLAFRHEGVRLDDAIDLCQDDSMCGLNSIGCNSMYVAYINSDRYSVSIIQINSENGCPEHHNRMFEVHNRAICCAVHHSHVLVGLENGDILYLDANNTGDLRPHYLTSLQDKVVCIQANDCSLVVVTASEVHIFDYLVFNSHVEIVRVRQRMAIPGAETVLLWGQHIYIVCQNSIYCVFIDRVYRQFNFTNSYYGKIANCESNSVTGEIVLSFSSGLVYCFDRNLTFQYRVILDCPGYRSNCCWMLAEQVLISGGRRGGEILMIEIV